MKVRLTVLTVTLTLGLLAAPVPGEAEQAGKLPRMGLLFTTTPATDPAPSPAFVAFWQRMSELGWVQGRSLVLEVRSAEGRPERLPAVAAELVGLEPDVIVVPVCGAPLNALRNVTSTIPIVVGTCNHDLVKTGVIASLARPGGNITGLTTLAPELAAKRLELLKDTLPKVAHVAVLWNPAYADFSPDWKEIRAAVRGLTVTLQSVEFRGPDDWDSAFSAMTRARADGLIVFPDVTSYIYRRRLADLAAKHRLPAMYSFREVVDAGGLMSFAPNVPDTYRRAADYVDKILKGTKPAALPVERPTKFELVINLKTAKALGLTIPDSVLFRADEVIK